MHVMVRTGERRGKGGEKGTGERGEMGKGGEGRLEGRRVGERRKGGVRRRKRREREGKKVQICYNSKGKWRFGLGEGRAGKEREKVQICCTTGGNGELCQEREEKGKVKFEGIRRSSSSP